jgi:signal transduction histidine kinase
MSEPPDPRDSRIENLRKLLADCRKRNAALRDSIDGLRAQTLEHEALVSQINALTDALTHSQQQLQALRRRTG